MGITREVGTQEVEGDSRVYVPVDPDPNSTQTPDSAATENAGAVQDDQ